MQFRIGQGYDIHRIRQGNGLMLGGVHLPAEFSLEAHSDGDVLLHAVIDAFLGALALGDIGAWFPDNSPEYLGANSAVLLKTVLDHKAFQAWTLQNLDCTIFAEKPKLAPWREVIRQSLATLLGCDISLVSVKAKTNEKLDALGRGEAIAASATILLARE